MATVFKNKLEASVSLNLEKTQREKLQMLEQEKFENDKLPCAVRLKKSRASQLIIF